MGKSGKNKIPQDYNMEAAPEFDAEGMLNPSSVRHKQRYYRYGGSKTKKNGDNNRKREIK